MKKEELAECLAHAIKQAEKEAKSMFPDGVNNDTNKMKSWWVRQRIAWLFSEMVNPTQMMSLEGRVDRLEKRLGI